MRDRDAERMTEQRDDGEPVGAGADHAGFGESARIGQPRPVRLRHRGRQKYQQQEHEQTRGQRAHAAKVAQPGVLRRKHGADVQLLPNASYRRDAAPRPEPGCDRRIVLSNARAAVQPLQPAHGEVTFRDLLEMVHEDDVDGCAERCADDRHRAGRRLVRDHQPEPGDDFADQVGDHRGGGIHRAALQDVGGGVAGVFADQRAGGVVADVEILVGSLGAVGEHFEAGEPGLDPG
ncbi:hypothetical protein NS44R_14695, partial [Mammaliicoccus sciuri]